MNNVRNTARKLIKTMLEGDAQPGYDVPYDDTGEEATEVSAFEQMRRIVHRLQTNVNVRTTPNINTLVPLFDQLLELIDGLEAMPSHQGQADDDISQLELDHIRSVSGAV